MNNLEKLHIVDVEEWFILREICNEIAHDYEDNHEQARFILNSIYQHRQTLKQILIELQNSVEF